MRVLTVVEDLAAGGVQRIAQNFATGYRRRGHPAAVLTFLGGGPREEALTEAGVEVFLGRLDDGTLEDAVERAIRWQPDLIHLHRYGRPDRVTGGILRDLRGSLDGPRRVIETNVMGKVDYSSARLLIDLHMPLTRWAFWKWSRWASGLRPRPVGVVMPNLIDTGAFGPVTRAEREASRAEAGVPPDAFVFGRLGQPLEEKWSPVMLAAFAAVATRHPDVYLLLGGVPPGLRARIERLPHAARGRVIEVPFTHSDAELRRRYGAMDAFLHASAIGESFGLVLAEAMLAELPVITLSTPERGNGHIEVVGHDEGGLVVADEGSMILAMERLLGDGSLRGRLARDGADSVRRRYDLDRGMEVLVRIAELTLKAPDRERLRADLAGEPDLVTHVTDSEIEALLSASLGRTPLRARLLMRLIHIGWLYRLYSRVRYR